MNKALLYYYFKSKEGLYQAVVGSQVREFQQQAREILSAKGPAGPILLRYVSYHFDFIGTHPHYPRIFQRMMMEGDRSVGAVDSRALDSPEEIVGGGTGAGNEDRENFGTWTRGTRLFRSPA